MYMNTIYYKHKEKMYNINKKLKHNFIILQENFLLIEDKSISYLLNIVYIYIYIYF